MKLVGTGFEIRPDKPALIVLSLLTETALVGVGFEIRPDKPALIVLSLLTYFSAVTARHATAEVLPPAGKASLFLLNKKKNHN